MFSRGKFNSASPPSADVAIPRRANETPPKYHFLLLFIELRRETIADSDRVAPTPFLGKAPHNLHRSNDVNLCQRMLSSAVGISCPHLKQPFSPAQYPDRTLKAQRRFPRPFLSTPHPPVASTSIIAYPPANRSIRRTVAPPFPSAASAAPRDHPHSTLNAELSTTSPAPQTRFGFAAHPDILILNPWLTG